MVERTSTTVAETTTVAPPPPPPPVAPLTGLPVNPGEEGLLGRPALAVKIDNSQPAVPQDGLNRADIVIEVKVEGISRLMSVFHSHDAASIGPTRSARHSDPDLLALFGRPLFGWSGANEEVAEAVLEVPWIVNVPWDRVKSAYTRRGPKAAPHNLYTSSAPLYGRATPDQAPPAPIFDRLAPGEAVPGASPIGGVSLSVGETPSSWAWDPASSKFLRWEYGRRHGTDEGQASADNVVILQTPYSRGPIAQTVGGGRAWLLVAGTIVEGTWTRPARTDRYTLTGLDGSPLKLAPGRTWIELPSDPPGPIDPVIAAALLANPR